MYIPAHFEVNDSEKVIAFMESHSFGQLISLVDGKLFSSQIPFFHEKKKALLSGHIARQNPQWEDLEGQEVLVTFQGPHDYVSPSWYDSPGVPTWNYQAVHVYGRAGVVTEKQRLGDIVDQLTKIHESSFEIPWSPEYRETMLNAIVGIEIDITEIQCQFKLSQNRPERDRKRVIEELRSRGSVQLSRAMQGEL